MIFQFGILCLLGSLSVSSALPPCVCTRNLRPVCGTDGQTYNNECRLNCAALDKPDLRMARAGSCDGQELGPPRDVRDIEQCVVCPYNYLPICGSDGQTYANECMFKCAQRSAAIDVAYHGECRPKRDTDCQICPLIYMPICGSDGKTYPNDCVFTCTKRAAVEMSYYGECRTKRDTAQVDELEQTQEPVPEINCLVCPANYAPICGTDGQTYANGCVFTCAQRSAAIQVAHYGECRAKRETVQVADLPTRSRCTCPRNFAPVCGNDGTTYDNPCILDCFSQNNPSLRFEHAGPCVVDLTNCSCSREMIPVCGTDQVTYDNHCFLECVQSKNSMIGLSHDGPCDENVELPAAKPDSCKCSRKPKPVCGTDGNTYRNPCMLNCARQDDESLHIDHDGECDNSVKVVEQAEIQSCTCTRNYRPVCSSNGVTFNNECLMRCAGTHLTVARQGPCEIPN